MIRPKRRILRYILTIFIFWILYIVYPNCKETRNVVPNKITKSTASYVFERNKTTEEVHVPIIYIVTPTYARLVQRAELTRLSQTLRHIRSIHWIVVEDAHNKTTLVTYLLEKCRIPYTHLFVKTWNETEWKELSHGKPIRFMHKGVQQRNLALDWLTLHGQYPHVVYFADDDNTYDLNIFEQMRWTRKVSVWPVAFAGQTKYESPAVKNGKVVGWITGVGQHSRRFGTDMAGFAVNGDLLNKTQARFSFTRFMSIESVFLVSMNISLDELEPKANNCTQVIGWITGVEYIPRFRVDMAGFAVNGHLLKTTQARFSYSGFLSIESVFLNSLNITLDDIEPKANNCTQILVWHTKTQPVLTTFDEDRQRIMLEFNATELEV